RAIEENPGKRIFLLSEMIHNPGVNRDLEARGVRFLMSTDGTEQTDFSTLNHDDIVIVPAFGTTVQLQQRLMELGIDPYFYDTTCPFVEKVWKRAAELGRQGFTVIVHGKPTHEETRATFSHSEVAAPTLIVRDMEDTEFLIDCMQGRRSTDDFFERFGQCISPGFDPSEDLSRVGVVNQTTMLATETHAISRRIRESLVEQFGEDKIKEHFADTRDTLCYATNENQTATKELIASGADLTVIVGGYNSSNTSHLVELCEAAMPTYYIKDAEEIVDAEHIRCFDLQSRQTVVRQGWLPANGSGKPVVVALTSGASCPDKTVDDVLERIVGFFPQAARPTDALSSLMASAERAAS
ncbi:MAG: hypothetical protein KDD44_12925, partial [Bdellovibrionales bacterium]|nr:hypothetical protein [Bdellovibrionales bacterium]